ncbi:acetyltransferase [Bacteroides sp.]|uniref:acetyltransferase n=1 Tax=Bacteroides sp. TaxID=29523 RepID=UPI0026297705|nr:acetyltransferase [Bacteroides sp.]
MRPLILVGGGGHCKSVIDAAESADFTIKGVLDIPENVGKFILGYQIIGTDDDIPKFVDDCDFIVTVGFIKDTSLRICLHENIEKVGGQLATVIASTAHVSRYAAIASGTVVLHQATINASVNIGKGCIINTSANIEHDAVIGNYCHISTGAMVNGDCKVGNCTFLGSQSVMVNATSIVDGCIIAAGAMVRKNIVQRGVYSGNPALLKIKI